VLQTYRRTDRHQCDDDRGKKNKVDNLYRGYIIDPVAAEPLIQYPLVHWIHAIGCHIQARWCESPRKVPNYTAWWTEAHWCEQLAEVVARQCSGRELNPRPPDHESNTLATTPPSHQAWTSAYHTARQYDRLTTGVEYLHSRPTLARFRQQNEDGTNAR